MRSRKAWLAVSCLVVLGLINCDFLTKGDEPGPSLIGEWDSKIRLTYRVEDSLFRFHFEAYLSDNGIDIDRYFTDLDYFNEKGAQFDSLVKSFSYTCQAPEPCQQILWVTTRKVTFTADSVYHLTFRNDSLVENLHRAYRHDDDSLYITQYAIENVDTLFSAIPYRFLERNTLVVFASLSFPFEYDTLIRVE